MNQNVFLNSKIILVSLTAKQKKFPTFLLKVIFFQFRKQKTKTQYLYSAKKITPTAFT